MKYNMIYTAAILSAAMTCLAACSDDEPVLTDRNLEGTSEYLDTDDDAKQDIYYKPT